MNKLSLKAIVILVIISFLAFVTIPWSYAQNLSFQNIHSLRQSTTVIAQAATETQEDNGEKTEESKELEEVEPAPVVIDGQEIFEIKVNIAEFTPEQRAEEIKANIEKVAQDTTISPESLKLIDLEGLRLIQAEDILIATFSESDAEAENTTLSDLTSQRLLIIKETIIEYRESRTQESIIRGIITAVISTVIAIICWLLLNRTLPRLFKKITTWQRQRLNSVGFQGLQFLSSRQIGNLVSFLFRIIRYFLIALLLYIYIPFLLSSFPWTKPLGVKLISYFWNSIGLVTRGIINYIPNLFIIAIISFIAYYTIRFAEIFFNAIKRGRISIRWFYPEWAEPTFNISKFLIIGFAFVLIFPYLPASDSAGFQGVSVFVGALVTFGSTTIIGNIVSGIVMIYTRSFQLGDIIQANGIRGQVVEKTILSTRILTPDNEIITIANANLIVSDITNYTSSIRDRKTPLILKTTITLGYDVPWRKVHQVLIDAAKSSKGILDNPEPFVLQTSLDDFYVSYCLKCFTNKPEQMGVIYSELHQNIQDKCNEADIEILSPHYAAVRDGHQTTIPAEYLPQDYQAPGFRLEN